MIEERWGNQPFDSQSAQDVAFDLIRGKLELSASFEECEKLIALAAVLTAIMGDETVLQNCGMLIEWVRESVPADFDVQANLAAILERLQQLESSSVAQRAAILSLPQQVQSVRTKKFKPWSLKRARGVISKETCFIDSDHAVLSRWSPVVAAQLSNFRKFTGFHFVDDARYGDEPRLLDTYPCKLLLRNWKLDWVGIKLCHLEALSPVKLSDFQMELSLLPLTAAIFEGLECKCMDFSSLPDRLVHLSMQRCRLPANFFEQLAELPELREMHFVKCEQFNKIAALDFLESRPEATIRLNYKLL